MDIKNVPLIVNLNNWVEELPPEYRSKAYEFAESFLCVGAMCRVFAEAQRTIAPISRTIPDSEDTPGKSSADKQKEYMVYLRTKAEENKVQ